MENGQKKILFIEDSADDRVAIERMLREEKIPHEFIMPTSTRAALEVLPSRKFDLIVASYHPADSQTLEILRGIEDIPAIIIADAADIDTARNSMKEVVGDVLLKDVNGNYLKALPHTIGRVLSQHEARMEVRRLQEFYRVLSEASPLGIFATDCQGSCTYTSERYNEITGFSTADCLGDGWFKAIHEEDRDRVLFEWRQAISNASIYHGVHRVVRPDGVVTWCSVKASPVFRSNAFDGHVGTIEDITVQKVTEQRLVLATSAAQIGIWEWDILYDKLIWDNSMFAIYGISHDQFSGAYEAWKSAVHPSDILEQEQELRLALHGIRDYNRTFRIRRPDGSVRFIRATGRVEKNGDGQPVRMVGTNLDVTELKETEENLRTILKETAQKTRLLDFISGIQSKFIENSEPGELFDSILEGLLELTESSYGFIGEILSSPEGKLYLKTHALRDMARDNGTVDCFASYQKEGLEFCNLEPLVSDTIVAKKSVIANDPRNEKHPLGLLPGHPELKSFAELPLLFENEVVGIVRIANRSGGYSEKFIQSLDPVLASCGNLISAMRMVRAKRLSDRELDEYRNRLELVLRAGKLGSWDWKIRTGEMRFDAGWVKMLGYEVNELEGSFDTWRSLLHPDDVQSVIQTLQDHLDGKTDFYETEHRLKAKDGSWVWVLDRGRVFERDVNGSPLRAVGTHLDITVRKKRDEELAIQQTLLSVFVENVPAAIAMFNTEMIYISASKAWSEEYKLGNQQLLGRSHYEVFNSISDEWRAIHKRALSGEVIRCEKDTWRPPHWEKDQTLRWEVRPWYFSSNKIGGIIVLSQDITDQCEREDELVAMRIAAEAAMFAKGQFLAHMSHEIRTPLTSIIGFAEAAREDGVTAAEQIQALNTILSNGKHLLGIINDILDFSKLDVGALEVEKRPISLVKLVDDIRVLMVPRLAEKGLSLIINYEWPLPETISIDGVRLMQILLNLTSNAVKFTERGRVEIKVWCNRNEQRAYFSVSDTGIGLTREEISRIFQPFVQADVGTSRKFGGTGLGLSISKQLVDRLGGEISVTSELNVGSTFTFCVATGNLNDVNWITGIPMNNGESLRDEKPARNLVGRLLIADDAADNRNLLQFILRKTNLDITFVENGKQAVDAVLEKPFDVILLDMQMPVMDGYTAAREMRAHGVKIPIIALTANAMKQDVLRCIEAGCTLHLPKPFGRDALLECLYQQLLAGSTSKSNGDVVLSQMFKDEPGSLSIVLEFVEGVKSRIENISSAIEAHDFVALKSAAHRLSGSAGLFGYGSLCDYAANLESVAQKEDVSEAVSLKVIIEREYDAILKGVQVMKGDADISSRLPLNTEKASVNA